MRTMAAAALPLINSMRIDGLGHRTTAPATERKEKGKNTDQPKYRTASVNDIQTEASFQTSGKICPTLQSSDQWPADP